MPRGTQTRWSLPLSFQRAEVSNPHSAGAPLLPSNLDSWGKAQGSCPSPHACERPSLGPGQPPEDLPGLLSSTPLPHPAAMAKLPPGVPQRLPFSAYLNQSPPSTTAPWPCLSSLLPQSQAQAAPLGTPIVPQPHPMECSFQALQVHLLPKTSLQLTDPSSGIPTVPSALALCLCYTLQFLQPRPPATLSHPTMTLLFHLFI